MATYEEIRDAACGLALEERGQLLFEIEESMPPPKIEISDYWKKEIRRRIKEMDSGTDCFVDHEEMLTRLRAKFS